jgi:hypothetical protein
MSRVTAVSVLSSDARVREPLLRTGWVLALCPAAAEGGGCFVAKRRPPSGGRGIPNPERSRLEAARRARGQLRRYCAANRLNRLGTLTYRGTGCHEPAQVRADLGTFFRSIRAALGGDPFPYVWVPEWHPGGHGLHAHFAVGKFIRQTVIRDAWGQGFVSIKLLSDLPVGTGRLEEARRAAGYLSKYVAKSFADQRLPGRHRYDVAQGFQPERVRIWGRSPAEVIGQASVSFNGLAPTRQWSSSDQEGWQGPPALWVQW